MPVLSIFESLKTNYFCIIESYTNIQNNINKVIENYIELDEKGYASTIHCDKLLCMARHFFSDIYSFLDIYAKIYGSLFSPKGKPAPARSFNEHRKKILQNSDINEFMGSVVPNGPTSECIIYSIKHSCLTQQIR